MVPAHMLGTTSLTVVIPQLQIYAFSFADNPWAQWAAWQADLREGNPGVNWDCVLRLALAAVYVQYHLADKVTDTALQSLRRLSWAAGHNA